MTSSSYCELTLRRSGASGLRSGGSESDLVRIAVQSWEIPAESSIQPQIPANRPAELTLSRGQTSALLRVRLEAEELMRLPRERNEWTVQITEFLREQYGLADLVVEEASSDEPDRWSPVLSLTLAIEAESSFERLHTSLVRELEEVHLALARDIASRTWHRRGGSTGEIRTFSPENDLAKLTELGDRLERALDRIGEQPSRSLRRTRVVGRWKPGDHITSRAAHRMTLEGSVQLDARGRLIPPRKTLLDRPRLATDIEEHRHIKSALLRLAERSALLARHCRRAIDLLEEDEGRWTGPAFEQRTRPRMESFESVRARAESLQVRFRRLLSRLSFLRDVGLPRTTLEPTPVFLGRVPYREAYRALCDAKRDVGGRFDGDGLRVRFRNLSTLYEYWLFVKVVGLLREMYGTPDGNNAFTLIDEVYRPELAPGQQFRFRLPRGDVLTATYEPDFPPVGCHDPASRYRSALVTGPLRPDVVLELVLPGRLPVMLALDAKSGPRFRKPLERLEDVAGYVWLVHDPANGHQPVRQLFLVHRDRDAAPACNVGGYLEGRLSPQESRILGAVPAAPGEVAQLRNVILRFLETFRSRRRWG